MEASLCKSPLSLDNAEGRGLRKDGSLRRKRALILCLALSRREATEGGKLISADVLSGVGRRKFSVREETKMGALAPPPKEGRLKEGGFLEKREGVEEVDFFSSCSSTSSLSESSFWDRICSSL